MTLRLSDDQLARLRLECWKWAYDHPSNGNESTAEMADEFVTWCLRDRPVEPEGRDGDAD